ncbi:NADH-quinone oxidoreductase subunit J [Fulvitalea axinellae]|uniref:NADH-quinone oxidoreductase subunit J n=1 Tax=Fulvitalea axinellae TaxID=1182444 RepID=A0AAU9DEC9_9BACT|nr:NADH-quinone oxidoreductase subunit J [Fulvitalea axinellae]
MSAELTIKVLFYVFAGIAILSAGAIVFMKDVLRAAFLLVLTFLSIAGVYVLLRADFIAVAQIMIYVGGILILMVFGVMLTNRVGGDRILSGTKYRKTSLAIGVAVFYILAKVIYISKFSLGSGLANDAEPMKDGSLVVIGKSIMTDYVLPFELAGVLLLVALIGASFLAAKSAENNNA